MRHLNVLYYAFYPRSLIFHDNATTAAAVAGVKSDHLKCI